MKTLHKKPEPHSVAEELVWLEACRVDSDAFEKIFYKYHDRIFSYALHRTGNANTAQDITANTFLKAFDNIKTFEWKGIALSSWLYRIATNEINLYYRSSGRTVRLTRPMTDDLHEQIKADTAVLKLEEEIAKNERFKKACAIIAKLKLRYQAVLSLRYFEDKSIREIAEILELSENTVKTRIRRGLIQIRDRYDQEIK